MKLPIYSALVFLLATGCSKHAAEEEAGGADAAPVQVATVSRASIPSQIQAEGVLYPLRQANLVPKVSAPVSRFLVQRGDHVRKGQLLAVLEDRDVAAAAEESRLLYNQAQATYQTTAQGVIPEDAQKANSDLESSEAVLNAARTVYQSRQALYQQGAIAQRSVSDAKVALAQATGTFDMARKHLQIVNSVGQAAQLRGAEAQVAAAKAHYQGAEAQLVYAEVRSPFDGVVSDRPVNVGEIAGAGSPVISIVSLSHVVARANVPVQQATKISVGRPATLTSGDTELNGKVTVVSPSVDPSTTTVQVWIEATNTGEHMKLGSAVQVTIDAGEVPNALIIPAVALLTADDGGEKVMVAGSDGLAHERAVKTGIHAGENVQVLDGLKEGEKVISEGALGLDDKAKIKTGGNEKDDSKGSEK